MPRKRRPKNITGMEEARGPIVPDPPPSLAEDILARFPEGLPDAVILLDVSDAKRVLGLTGFGKSVTLANMARQLIGADALLDDAGGGTVVVRGSEND